MMDDDNVGTFKITEDVIDKGKLNGMYFEPMFLQARGRDGNWFVVKCTGSQKIVDKKRFDDFEGAEKVRFRLKDDDGEIYHYGEMRKCDLDDKDEDMTFIPLDSFGNAFGCTTIEYEKDGKWEMM
jgi:hypothetical protein